MTMVDAGTLGLVTGYRDAFGGWRESPPASVEAVAAALTASTIADPDALLPPVLLARPEAVLTLPPFPTAPTAIYLWQLKLENGDVRTGQAESGAPAAMGLVPLGYHRLILTFGPDVGVESWVISTPARTFAPDWFATPAGTPGAGHWGFSVQLYGLRRGLNWGIGDFGDLRALIGLAAAAGAGAIGLNPLHARFSAEPDRISPYSPSSRFFLDPLMIAVPDMAGAAECPELQAMIADADFGDRLAALRATALVDHVGVSAVKHGAFHVLHRWFEHAPAALQAEYAAFREEHGGPLRRFAAFETLHAVPEHAAAWWRHWPDGLSVPDPATVDAIAARYPAEFDYHMFLQWQADRQLAACSEVCRGLNMPVGLYLDLAVGVDAGGADAWAEGPALISDVALGAPPDPMNVKGQNWGLPPFNPIVLRERGHAPFATVLRSAMRHAGAVRLDHVIGLMRLYLVPNGTPATEGVFLLYPIDELLAVLALESARYRCIVIGEDLGTLPDGLQDKLAAAGVLSYRVLMFEQRDGRFLPPEAYPRDALVVASTHDLPSLEGWLAGHDIGIKQALDLLGDISAEDYRAGRADEVARLKTALVEAGVLMPGDTGPDAMAIAMHRFIARTPSRLAVVQIEDAAGAIEQANLPGTHREHPNWQRKLPLPLDALFDSERLRGIAAAMRDERPATWQTVR